MNNPSVVASLRIRIFGSLAVEGVEMADLGSRKQRSLLRLLALHGGTPVSVDRIADCLWPDEAPTRPAEQVGVLISRLRATLGTDRLTRSDAGYSVVADWIDREALEQLTVEAEHRLHDQQPTAAATAAEAGLALVVGPLLADEGDTAWADEARRSVDRTINRLRLAATEALLATSDPFAAAQPARPRSCGPLRRTRPPTADDCACSRRPSRRRLSGLRRGSPTLAEGLGARPSDLTEEPSISPSSKTRSNRWTGHSRPSSPKRDDFPADDRRGRSSTGRSPRPASTSGWRSSRATLVSARPGCYRIGPPRSVAITRSSGEVVIRPEPSCRSSPCSTRSIAT